MTNPYKTTGNDLADMLSSIYRMAGLESRAPTPRSKPLTDPDLVNDATKDIEDGRFDDEYEDDDQQRWEYEMGEDE